MTTGKISASPIAFEPRRPPRRNETSPNPSWSARRATTDAAAGVHMSAEIHHELPLIASVSNTTESGIRTAKYMIRPRRARSRILLSAASNAGDVLKLNDIPFPRIVVPVNLPRDGSSGRLSHNDKNHCLSDSLRPVVD